MDLSINVMLGTCPDTLVSYAFLTQIHAHASCSNYLTFAFMFMLSTNISFINHKYLIKSFTHLKSHKS
jgi:hypothetical protein